MDYEMYWVTKGSGWQLTAVHVRDDLFWDYVHTFGARVEIVYDYAVMYEEWLDQSPVERVVCY